MTTHTHSSHAIGPIVDFDPDTVLAELEAVRQRQLESLPAVSLDAVAAAHRATVERILDEIRKARRRVAEGRYGLCAGCDLPIAEQRLEVRPWTVTCAPCAERAPH